MTKKKQQQPYDPLNTNSQPTPKSKRQKYNASDLLEITPQTDNQEKAFQAWDDGYNLVLAGAAGSGKSFVALHMAFEELLESQLYDKVIIVRSVVPTRDIGFLPGDKDEKIDIYQAPYKAICSELFGEPNSFDKLVKAGQLEFLTTSFIRGLTLDNSILIVDEMQNMTGHELDTVITRMGENSKIIFCGDYHQSDLTKRNEKKELLDFLKILENCFNKFKVIYFKWEDILRSDLVRDYIMTKEMMRRKDDFEIDW